MYSRNIAFLDEKTEFHLREDRGDYDVESGADPTVMDQANELYEAQRQIGDALNLAGLLLAALENECDSRAMQIHTVAQVIQKKLANAYDELDRHDANHTELLLAYNELKDRAGETR